MRLVETLATEVRNRHAALYSLTMFIDLPEFRRDRPQPIAGFVPDLFAVDTPETCRIIGEAKTPLDFETERSRAQIAAFLTHLSRFPTSHFYLAVPLLYRLRAESLVGGIRSDVSASGVGVHVIGGG